MQLEEATTTAGRNQILDNFFSLIDQQRQAIMQMQQPPVVDCSSPMKKVRSPMKRSSPMKSPVKKSRKVVDENCSPTKDLYMSPSKKQVCSPIKGKQEDRPSHGRRRQAVSEEEVQGPTVNGASPTHSASGSPLKGVPKSPVKRMRKLEQEANLENQENIEQTYEKTQRDSPKSNISEEEEESQLDPKFLSEEPKSILSSKDKYQCEDDVTETQAEQRIPEIARLIDVDSNVINYGQFICGKILGSTLLLSNISGQDQILTLQISKKAVFCCDEIFGQYNRGELPFQYEDGTTITNSENDYQCWYIENPVSKELQKQITVKIGPEMSQEFIIVVKAPKNKLLERVVSFIDIQMTNDLGSNTEKRLSRMDDRVVLKEQAVPNRLEILLLGYLDNPVVKCMKQLVNKATGSEIVSLAVKRASGIQKFKLPFKNLSSYLDCDIEFAFIRAPQQTQLSQIGDMLDPIECFSFYCQPNQLKITAEQIQILTVQVKVNTDTLDDETKVEQRLLKQPLNKLLVARLKNSQVLFSFFVSITLVE